MISDVLIHMWCCPWCLKYEWIPAPIEGIVDASLDHIPEIIVQAPWLKETGFTKKQI